MKQTTYLKKSAVLRSIKRSQVSVINCLTTLTGAER